MAQSQNTIREFFVANAALSAETSLKDFTADAAVGEIGVYAKGGETAAYGVPFVVAIKTADSVIVSDVINPTKVESLKKVDFAPEVQKVVTLSAFEVPATAGEKYEYIVDIRLFNHGSLSIENFYIKHGQFTLTQTTAPQTAEAVVDALISNLNKNFSKEPGATASTNPLFTFAKVGAGASASLTITSKEQPQILGKKEGRALEFDVVIKAFKVGDEYFGVPQPVVTLTTPAHPGVGTGKQVAKLEFFYKGSRGDVFRGVGYPYTWENKYFADATAEYDLIELKQYFTGDGLNALKMPKEITIAVNKEDGDADGVLAAIEEFTTPV